MLARWVARALEEGELSALPFARAASSAWGRVAARGLARPLRAPRGVAVVAVGGATLGGSGKTPLAIACARALASRGHEVALVGHAYRASPGAPRVVAPDDPLALVGDEALACARALADAPRARVVVAETRQAAIDHAARDADVLVVDGLAQTAPARAALALLAVEAREPWGRAAATPPRGDLRAPVEALLATADVVVPIHDDDAPLASDVAWARVRMEGGRVGGALLGWDELRRVRVGLATACARPSRIAAALARRGVHPRATLTFADHHPPRSLPAAPIDLWLVTEKCGVALRSARAPRPVAVLDYRLELGSALVSRLASAARQARERGDRGLSLDRMGPQE